MSLGSHNIQTWTHALGAERQLLAVGGDAVGPHLTTAGDTTAAKVRALLDVSGRYRAELVGRYLAGLCAAPRAVLKS